LAKTVQNLQLEIIFALAEIAVRSYCRNKKQTIFLNIAENQKLFAKTKFREILISVIFVITRSWEKAYLFKPYLAVQRAQPTAALKWTRFRQGFPAANPGAKRPRPLHHNAPDSAAILTKTLC
jgi:hypothetical protein